MQKVQHGVTWHLVPIFRYRIVRNRSLKVKHCTRYKMLCKEYPGVFSDVGTIMLASMIIMYNMDLSYFKAEKINQCMVRIMAYRMTSNFKES
jgi:hypothetical protein